MNGDSFIYLDKRFVNYLYDNSLSNDPFIKKLVIGLVVAKTDYAFDRTKHYSRTIKRKKYITNSRI